MPDKQTLKRYFIIAIIASLVASALLGILVVLLGGFGELEGKILASTLVIGILSVTSLANLRNFESPHPSYHRFAIVSIGCSFIALLFTLSMIWIGFEHTPWKPT